MAPGLFSALSCAFFVVSVSSMERGCERSMACSVDTILEIMRDFKVESPMIRERKIDRRRDRTQVSSFKERVTRQ